ncbi:MAG: TetR/AcrR family transcriptional regulator [Gaiella sp.]|nr:TetR/AcrR family transcriptional regulator [Gaiella sp.]
MPKIDAATVSEHRTRRLELLVSAAEEILAEDGLDALTAGAVARRAGLARNSLYRYFASIDDLVELVVTRGFPQWVEAVETAVAAQSTPQGRITAYVESSLRQAAESTHGWRSSLSRASLSDTARRRVLDMHLQLQAIAHEAFAEIDAEHPELLLTVVQSLVDACTRRIDAGDEPDVVISYAVAATERLLEPATDAVSPRPRIGKTVRPDEPTSMPNDKEM